MGRVDEVTLGGGIGSTTPTGRELMTPAAGVEVMTIERRIRIELDAATKPSSEVDICEVSAQSERVDAIGRSDSPHCDRPMRRSHLGNFTLDLHILFLCVCLTYW